MLTPDDPVAHWPTEVGHDSTRQGYWEWSPTASSATRAGRSDARGDAVIDVRQRLRGAGMRDEQADLIAGAFEQLDRRLRRLEVLTGVIIALQVATLTTVIVLN